MRKYRGFPAVFFGLFFWLMVNGPLVAAVESSPTSPQTKVFNKSPISCSIEKDGRTYTPTNPVYISEQSHILISLADTVQLFSCHLKYQEDGTLLVQRLDTSIIFRPGEYFARVEFNEMTPLQRLNNIFIPVAAVAGQLGYVVKYQSDSALLSLYSPEYKTHADNANDSQFDPVAIPDPPENLPTWGKMVPELSANWPQEKIIGAYYTTLINSPEGRTHNIILSCASIDGTILESGEVFSFNQIVGERTTEAGYREAKIFVGNTVTNGLGGGICQTATTLYNAGLTSGLQIVERHPHTLPVSYIGSGYDATVSWSGADLKMRNNSNHTVKILCCVYGQYVVAAVAEAP